MNSTRLLIHSLASSFMNSIIIRGILGLGGPFLGSSNLHSQPSGGSPHLLKNNCPVVPLCPGLWLPLGNRNTLQLQDTELRRKENKFEYFTSCAKSHSGPRLLQLIRRSECGEWGVLSSVISNSPNFISHIISNIAGEHIFHQSFFVNVWKL